MPTATTEASAEVRKLVKTLHGGSLSRLDHLIAIRSHFTTMERDVRFHGLAPERFRLARIAAHAIALMALEIERENGSRDL